MLRLLVIKTTIGHLHPLSLVRKQVTEIFQLMGFSIAEGPEMETEWYNFDSLNIPKDHPARDMQDTFFIQDKDDKNTDEWSFEPILHRYKFEQWKNTEHLFA